MGAVRYFKKFIREIGKEDKLVLAYDKDGDGVSAVVIAKTALTRLGLESETFAYDRAHVEEFINHVENEKADGVIVFDISAEQHPHIFKRLPKTKFMIIDHHKKYGSPKGVTIIKPGDIGYKGDPGHYPTAKLSYFLFSKLTKIDDLAWVACVGIISDFAYSHFKRSVDSVLKKRGWARPKDINESVPGKIAALINASNAIRESRIEDALDLLLTLDPKKILSSDLAKPAANTQAERDKIVSQYKEKGEILYDGKLIFYEIEPTYKVGGAVSNSISVQKPKSFVLIAIKSDGWVKFSARCQKGGIPTNEVLEKATAGLRDAKAGGHKPASGAIIHKQDFPEFKKRLLKEIKKYLK